MPEAQLSPYAKHFLAEHLFRKVHKTYGKGDFWTGQLLQITARQEDYLALLPAAWPYKDFGTLLGILTNNPLFKERLGVMEEIRLNGLCIEDTDFLRHCSFRLERLDLSHNLQQEFPSALPGLRSLRVLHLDENKLRLEQDKLRPLLEHPELHTLSLLGNPGPADLSADILGRFAGDNALSALRRAVLLSPSMIPIPGGTFGMGQPDGTLIKARIGEFTVYSDDEQPVHPVTLSDYCLGKYAVTLGEFRAFVEDTGYVTYAERGDAGSFIWNQEILKSELRPGVNWRHDANGKEQTNERHPVLHVCWYDAVEFCNWLSRKNKLQEAYQITANGPGSDYIVNLHAKGYRLPTEAEWEYAARERGREVRFGNGKDIANPSEINYNGGAQYQTAYSIAGVYRGCTVPVGTLPPNALGLHEMSGNVWEWCGDWYGAYSAAAQTNPKGPSEGTLRVLRGGGWGSNAENCRSANRSNLYPDNRGHDVGFRLVFVP